MTHPFYTIGHGTRPLAELVELLQSVEVTLLVDVRTVPRSRTNPQYNRDVLPASLAPFGIAYEHNYADYAMGAVFREALAHLRERGRAQNCAIMCAETVWWRCHRRIITDYLLASGETVLHVLGPGHIEAAAMTEAARPRADGSLEYPAGQGDLFDQAS
jgi:uncharacterized protein (DUF488 family)